MLQTDAPLRAGRNEKGILAMPVDLPNLLDLIQVAQALNVSPHTVRSWVRKGRLQPLRICRRLLFLPEELDRFINSAKGSL